MKTKVIVRGDKYDDVIFAGYSVTPTGMSPVTITKFTIRYPHIDGQRDFILMDASANKWIGEQQPLRGSAVLLKALEGAVIDATKGPISTQLTVSLNDQLAVMSDEGLAELIAKAQARLDANKPTETTTN